MWINVACSRLREIAKKGLQVLAEANNVGPAAVGLHALKALPEKQKTAWRPIAARLQLLRDLVSDAHHCKMCLDWILAEIVEILSWSQRICSCSILRTLEWVHPLVCMRRRC
mmetsp:Transcript_15235/g.22436  ORF Transcript_15235/g.22436 Transcript_15235/m.22436 type:complete len:112 (-) Transcript_15235:1428-1763(-)